jgi:hypothetical protein
MRGLTSNLVNKRLFNLTAGFLNPNYFSGDQIENNEMGGSCSMYGGEYRRIQGFGVES